MYAHNPIVSLVCIRMGGYREKCPENLGISAEKDFIDTEEDDVFTRSFRSRQHDIAIGEVQSYVSFSAFLSLVEMIA